MNLPSEGFSLANAATVQVEGDLKNVESKELSVGFRELERAASTPDSRAYYEGATVNIVGEVPPGAKERVFTLVRYKMVCCAADATPLQAVIMIDPKSEEKLPPDLEGKWVEVTGQLQFLPRRDRPGTFATVISIQPTQEKPLGEFIKPLKGRPANPFLN
jgi:hypothetical protein